MTGQHKKPEQTTYLPPQVQPQKEEEVGGEKGEILDKDKERLLAPTPQNFSQFSTPEQFSNLLPSEIVDKVKNQFPKLKLDQPYDFVPTEEDLNRKRYKLFEHINDDQILRKHIPKQKELDKFIEELKHKIIHKYYLPITHRELKAEYKNSPFFRDMIQYIVYDKCTYVGKPQDIFKTQCEEYIVVDGILFKLQYNSKTTVSDTVLCVPEKYIPSILHEYHKSILAGHPGVTKSG